MAGWGGVWLIAAVGCCAGTLLHPTQVPRASTGAIAAHTDGVQLQARESSQDPPSPFGRAAYSFGRLHGVKRRLPSLRCELALRGLRGAGDDSAMDDGKPSLEEGENEEEEGSSALMQRAGAGPKHGMGVLGDLAGMGSVGGHANPISALMSGRMAPEQERDPTTQPSNLPP